MKIRSEIIKEFGLFLLLFVSVSIVAVSEDTNGEFTDTVAIFGNDSVWTNEEGTTHYESANGETSETSVTIEETPSSEDVNGNGTNTGGSTDSDGSDANDNPNSGIVPPNSSPDESTHEKLSIDEWWELILSAAAGEDVMLPPLPSVEDTIDFTTIGDLP